MKSDRTIKNLREYDIQTFIDNNRIYTLSLIIAFYIISRLVTIVSIVVNHEQIGGTEFLTKIIFHVVNLIILLISVKAIISKKQKIVIGWIGYNYLYSFVKVI